MWPARATNGGPGDFLWPVRIRNAERHRRSVPSSSNRAATGQEALRNCRRRCTEVPPSGRELHCLRSFRLVRAAEFVAEAVPALSGKQLTATGGRFSSDANSERWLPVPRFFAEEGSPNGAFWPMCGRSSENVVFWTFADTSDIIRAAKREASVNHQTILLAYNAGVGSAIHQEGAVLRLRMCGCPECRAVFAVCASCDRGQRYCCQSCRDTVRRRQRRAADRRYQQSERGRRSHRHRQGRYRERRAGSRVTDQPLMLISSPPPSRRAARYHCLICSRFSTWINPFRPIPRRR